MSQLVGGGGAFSCAMKNFYKVEEWTEHEVSKLLGSGGTQGIDNGDGSIDGLGYQMDMKQVVGLGGGGAGVGLAGTLKQARKRRRIQIDKRE